MHPPQSKHPSTGVELCPGKAGNISCIGLFCYLNEAYAAEMATNRDQDFISCQKVIISGSVAGTVTAVKQFSSLKHGFFTYNYHAVKGSLPVTMSSGYRTR